MKALFYTATAVFIALAGLIAYFAVQSPSSLGEAKVVLDIDVSGMPSVEGENTASAPLDPYGNEQDEKPVGDGQALASHAETPGHRSDGGETHAPSASAAQAEDPGLREAQREEIPPPPPGTALAGLEQDRPLFREVEPDLSSPTGAGGQDSPSQTAAEPDFALPGANLDQPASRPGQRQAAQSPGEDPNLAPAPPTASSALTAPAEIAAPVLPPPPVPTRRPSNIPGPEERLASAEDGFGGLQFATTEVTTPRAARIAILLRGVGRNEADGAQAIARLPSAVSLGFLPYSASAQRFAAQAREKGHEIIVQLPLEPVDYPASDPGPDTLLTSLPAEENAARLDAVLTRFQGYTGVTNLMGGKMLQSKTSLKPVLEDIKARGLVFVGESNNSSAAARQVAREINLRFGAAQVLIDAQATPEAIDKALQRLVALARQSGSAIGMGTASGVTIAQVQAWSERLATQGVTLVPVGALAQTPGSS